MQKDRGTILYSATDLVNFLECEHLSSLDLANLETPLERTADSEEAALFQNKGNAHELAYLGRLKSRYEAVTDIKAESRPDPAVPSSDRSAKFDAAVQATVEAMQAGSEIIYQAALRQGQFIGHADFLRRVPGNSKLGNYHYEVIDTKLARSAKAKFLIQLCFYSDLLADTQGTLPAMTHVVLGDSSERSFRVADYSHYYATAKARFLAFVQQGGSSTYPDPKERCDTCQWRGLCEARRLADDHLCQVANIRKLQIRRLSDAGLGTLSRLGAAPAGIRVPNMVAETFDRLRNQARLQAQKKETGKDYVETLPEAVGAGLGFDRLPPPSPGDLFFDMEGDPLEEGGLEYLFGVSWVEGSALKFRPFWAHTRAEERKAFEAFMDFVSARLKADPDLHIYHYAAYENSALKRLMSLHGTREAEVDNLLRQDRLVDLYRVVREAVRVSEPAYSIKNLETFYLGPRTGEVQNAGASIVYYERWKALQEPGILEKIQDYNEYDCRSTFELRKWLIGLRPPLEHPLAEALGAEDIPPQEPSENTLRLEARLQDFATRLTGALPEDRAIWTEDHRLRELTFQLLDFHRRAAKPEWWAIFSRMDTPEEDLNDDVECIAGMTRDPAHPPVPDKRSIVYTYLYPEQETKLKNGDSCTQTDTAQNLGKVQVDPDARRVVLRMGNKRPPPPARLSIGPGAPIGTEVLREALPRFAKSVDETLPGYSALKALLRRAMPRIKGIESGAPIVDESKDLLPQAIEAVSNLENSYLFLQGPPGAGKTYSGSHIIVDLIRQGKRVAVSSNSHKAINNLLEAVERTAQKSKVSFRGVKKATAGNADTEFDGSMFENIYVNEEIDPEQYALVAGTAWLFADSTFDQAFDYLFVDEAGQVALANLVAMGTCARNIVLLGDQMQLGQPVQGVHPGRSGDSTLDYLLDGKATIPPEQGIFLKTTWRMHPDVCRFISEAVYDGRLEPEKNNARQRLVLLDSAHPELRPTGVRMIEVAHEGCSQRSDEEARLIGEIYSSLLGQQYVDSDGKQHAMGLANILVVAPYNMQVNLLKTTLPEGARVGTVDKFQGQEAEAVIVSMATSSEEEMPRNVEFLFSKNRLNVAISRARCLTLVVASPRLLTVSCKTPEQMALVNTLCWVRSYTSGVV